MTVSEYDVTHITASFSAKENCVLFTTIPYEKGWTVTVDGEKIETFAFKDAFLAFEMKKGNHQIQFSYSPYGMNIGIGISLVSLFIFCGLIYYNKRQNSSKSFKKEAKLTSE